MTDLQLAAETDRFRRRREHRAHRRSRNQVRFALGRRRASRTFGQIEEGTYRADAIGQRHQETAMLPAEQ